MAAAIIKTTATVMKLALNGYTLAHPQTSAQALRHVHAELEKSEGGTTDLERASGVQFETVSNTLQGGRNADSLAELALGEHWEAASELASGLQGVLDAAIAAVS